MNSHAILEIMLSPCIRRINSTRLRLMQLLFLLIHNSVQLFPKLYSNSCDYLYKLIVSSGSFLIASDHNITSNVDTQ